MSRKIRLTYDEETGEVTARVTVTLPFGPEEYGRTSITSRDLELPDDVATAVKELADGLLETHADEVAKAARKDTAMSNYIAEVRGDFDHPPGEAEPAEGAPKLETRPRTRKRKT